MTRRTALAAWTATLLAPDVLDRVPTKADARVPYGADANQFGDLRIPPGKGPFPVVVNIDGGF